jgi:hypothetical protein
MQPVMTTFQALATVRRNLVQRIERYLAELETREAVIGRNEGDHLARALDRLGVDNFPEGEREMSWASRAIMTASQHRPARSG